MFTTKIKIRFNHVDPAGIVFYPRYYEMFNQVIEEWFEQMLDCNFRQLNDDLKAGIPAAEINVQFLNPSRLSDEVTFELELLKLGNSSINLNIRGRVGDEPRVDAKVTLVFIQENEVGIRVPTRVTEVLRKPMMASLAND